MSDFNDRDFVSIAAHQLRTPLTPIRWFSKLLLSGATGELNAEQKEFVQYIYDNNERMVNLLNTLLQIVRVTEGRVEMNTKPEDIVELAKKVVVSLAPIAQGRGIKVSVHEPPVAIPLVPIDEVIMWQVLQNLLSNAIRYSFENGEIELGFAKKDDWLEIYVQDNGIGIPEDFSEKVYQKFVRTPGAAKMVPEGSGLGLSLAKSLVEAWGGKLWHDSEEGRGTTFHFSLPLTGPKRKIT